MKKVNKLKKVLIFLITIVFIYLISINISITNVIEKIKLINISTLLMCFVIHLFVYFFRTLPMSLLLGKKVPFLVLLNAHFIHNFYLQIIPASLGELSLPIQLRHYIKMSTSLTILIITRIITTIVVFLLFTISVLSLFKNFSVISFNKETMLYVLLGFLFFVLIILLSHFIGLFKLPLLKKYINKIKKILSEAKELLVKNANLRSLILMIFSNIIYLFFMAYFYKILLVDLNVDVNILELFFIMSIQVAILLLPIKSFGGFGTVEGSWLIGMLMLGFDRAVSLESGFIIHIIALISAAIFFIIGIFFRVTLLKNKN